MPYQPVTRDTEGVYHNNSKNNYDDALEGVTRNYKTIATTPKECPKMTTP